MGAASFVHLHGHSNWSLLDGAARVEDIIKQAIAWQMPAVAVTDHGAMYGIAEAYLMAKKYAKEAEVPFKLIPGVEVYVAPRSRFDKSKEVGDDANWHLVLWALDNTGLSMLYQLVSESEMYYKPRIDKDLLRELVSREGQGHIAGSSACLGSEISQAILKQGIDKAARAAGEYYEILGPGNFFLELQDHGLAEQRQVNAALIQLSHELGIPLIASNDYHYLRPEDAYYHDILLCIQTGKRVSDTDRMRYETNQFYFKSPVEMENLFGKYPAALRNTLQVAERCQVEMDFETVHLPKFEIPNGFADADAYLRYLAEQGAVERYGELSDNVRQRLDYELSVIKKMGYSDYFLIVWDFIAFARSKGIAVGPGRGSAAGSIVAYCLHITNVDPLKYGLLFERFLNPERVTLPDIDIDFCYHRRNEVIRYVVDKYGSDRVAQIITFGTLKPRAAVRDVARVLGVSLRKADSIAKSIPFDAKTLAAAMERSSDLKSAYETDDEVKQVIDAATYLTGFPRHASTHAAGVVIAPRPLKYDIPLYKPEGQKVITEYATEFPMGILEEMKFLKMDFLALRNLSVIQDTVAWVKRIRGEEIEIDNIDFNDPKVYELFSRGETSGVFQFESDGMRQLLRDFQPESIAHLTLLNAMYRPGPMQYIQTVVRRRQGKESISWPHPDLEPILRETYGIMAYQEQIMAVAHQFAGMSLGQADMLRRAVAKKKQSIIDAERQSFIQGAVKKGYDAELAEKIYSDIEKFANYGFNKSHSCAYATVAYQTAYLKVHYPTEYMASLLTSVMGKYKNVKLGEYLQVCRDMGIEVLPPDVNTSEATFVPRKDHRIVFGLTAVKNVGENAVKAIIEERKKRPFSSFYDFCTRVRLGKEVMLSLIRVGAFDSLGVRRSQLLAVLDEVMKATAGIRNDNQLTFFDIDQSGFGDLDTEIPLPDIEELPQLTRLQDERELIGVYISGHPLDEYEAVLAKKNITRVSDLREKAVNASVTLAGVVTDLRIVTTKRGEDMAFAVLEDKTGPCDLTIFPRTWAQYRQLLESQEVLVVDGKNDSLFAEEAEEFEEEAADDEVEVEEFQARVIVNSVRLVSDLVQAGVEPERRECHMEVWLNADQVTEPELHAVRDLLAAHRGKNPVYLVFKRRRLACLVDSGLWVDGSQELQDGLKGLLGQDAVVVQDV